MFVRSLFAVALAALLAGPSTAHAQKKSTAKAAPAASTTTTDGGRQFSIGGWVGAELGDLDGVQLRGEGEMSFMKLAPMVELSFVGAVSYSYLADDAGPFDWYAHVFKLVPAARFTFPVAPKFKLFADAGLGLYIASVGYDYDTIFGSESDSETDAGFMLRLGGGGMFQVNPRMAVGGQFVIDPMFGDYDDTTVTLLAGLTFKL
jgi:hypothetical protein